MYRLHLSLSKVRDEGGHFNRLVRALQLASSQMIAKGNIMAPLDRTRTRGEGHPKMPHNISFGISYIDVESTQYQQYEVVFNELLNDPRESQYLHSLNAASLIESGALLAHLNVEETGCLVCAAYINIHQDVHEWCGLITPPKYRGNRFAHLLVANGRHWAAQKFNHNRAYAEIRVFPDGTLNDGAAKIFGQLGFVPGKLLTRPVATTPNAGHLVPTQDSNGDYQSLTLRAGPESIDSMSAIVRAGIVSSEVHSDVS